MLGAPQEGAIRHPLLNVAAAPQDTPPRTTTMTASVELAAAQAQQAWDAVTRLAHVVEALLGAGAADHTQRALEVPSETAGKLHRALFALGHLSQALERLDVLVTRLEDSI